MHPCGTRTFADSADDEIRLQTLGPVLLFVHYFVTASPPSSLCCPYLLLLHAEIHIPSSILSLRYLTSFDMFLSGVTVRRNSLNGSYRYYVYMLCGQLVRCSTGAWSVDAMAPTWP